MQNLTLIIMICVMGMMNGWYHLHHKRLENQSQCHKNNCGLFCWFDRC